MSVIIAPHKQIYTTAFMLRLIFSCWTVCFGCNIGAGSYSYAETYNIPASEQKVIEAVNDFKAQHPEIVVPISGVNDGRIDSSDHWYHIYFYLPKANKIVYCWTRPENKNETTFAIVGVNEGLKLGNWKYVNKDFSSSENKKILEELEKTLINPIIEIVQKENGLQ